MQPILVFIGAKILLAHFITIPMPLALGVVGGLLLLSVLASVVWSKKRIEPQANSSTFAPYHRLLFLLSS